MKGFEINTQLTLEESLKEVILGRISFITDQFRDQEDRHRLIHDIRRSINRVRAVLRLIRDEIGYSHYFRENRFYRDLARRMAPVRDSYVLFQTLNSLEARHTDLLPANDLTYLKERLTFRIEEDLTNFQGTSGGFESILLELSIAGERTHQYCQIRDGFNSVSKGLERVYKKGRKHQSAVRNQFNMDLFHEYRKNTKYLQFQTELIQPIFPKIIRAYSGTLAKHSELLGHIRDYDRLDLYIRNEIPEEIQTEKGRRLLEEIGKHREELIEKVCLKPQLIYAEKPKEFLNRIKIYWNHQYGLT